MKKQPTSFLAANPSETDRLELDRGAGAIQDLPRTHGATTSGARTWFWMSLTMFAVTMICAAGLLMFRTPLAAHGLTGGMFYVAVIPAGLCAALLLFGALRSYAKYEGHPFGASLTLGGPIVVFALVVLGAFMLPESGQPFSLIVRLHGAAGPTEVIRTGRVIVDFGTDRRTKKIGRNGEAYFNEVPHRFTGATVKVIATSPGFEMVDAREIKIPETHVIYVEMKKSAKPDRVSGHVVDSKGKRVPGAVLSIDGVAGTTVSDQDGAFRIPIGPDVWRDGLRLRATKGDASFDDYVTPSGSVTITLKEDR